MFHDVGGGTLPGHPTCLKASPSGLSSLRAFSAVAADGHGSVIGWLSSRFAEFEAINRLEMVKPGFSSGEEISKQKNPTFWFNDGVYIGVQRHSIGYTKISCWSWWLPALAAPRPWIFWSVACRFGRLGGRSDGPLVQCAWALLVYISLPISHFLMFLVKLDVDCDEM